MHFAFSLLRLNWNKECFLVLAKFKKLRSNSLPRISFSRDLSMSKKLKWHCLNIWANSKRQWWKKKHETCFWTGESDSINSLLLVERGLSACRWQPRSMLCLLCEFLEKNISLSKRPGIRAAISVVMATSYHHKSVLKNGLIFTAFSL